MDLRIEEGTVFEPPVVEADLDGGRHRITVKADDHAYSVTFPEARRQDVIYGLSQIVGELEEVGS